MRELTHCLKWFLVCLQVEKQYVLYRSTVWLKWRDRSCFLGCVCCLPFTCKCCAPLHVNNISRLSLIYLVESDMNCLINVVFLCSNRVKKAFVLGQIYFQLQMWVKCSQCRALVFNNNSNQCYIAVIFSLSSLINQRLSFCTI